MWRLAWVAHAIRTAPADLFNANIFHPEPLTLAYSDAMLLPGVILAPLFWAGAHPVIVYNLALFTAFIVSGLAAFWLAREVTGHAGGAMVAGVIYAFAPYRFTHYAHLELQFVFWIPLLLLAIHRTLPRPQRAAAFRWAPFSRSRFCRAFTPAFSRRCSVSCSCSRSSQ
jgi:hypothetical protein